MNKIWDKVLHQLKAIGCDARVVAAGHVNELREEIETSRSHGRFSEEFYQERLSFFEFHPPKSLQNPQSIIVIAAPQPQVQVMFIWNKRTRRFVVPPTYNESVNAYVQELLQRILEPGGYHLAPTALPLKLLAVRSELATYGKNNITYVQGVGSYHRLMAFYSDLECTSDSWGPSTMMERCVKCSACVKGCPTQAIDHERFLLRAERCLTFHNESLKDFPEWIPTLCHHCIVGCMNCQTFCPENKRDEHWIELGASFSQEETELLMRHTPADTLPDRMKDELERLGLIDYLDILPRNLDVLVRKEDELSHPSEPETMSNQ